MAARKKVARKKVARKPTGMPVAEGEQAKLGQQLIANVKQQIFQDARQGIMDSLEESDGLATTIGQIAAELMVSQLDAMDAVGKKLSQDLFADAGNQIVTELFELAEAMGLVEGDIQQQQTKALMVASHYFAQIGAKYLDPQDVERFVGDAVGGKYDAMGDTDAQPV